MQLESMFLLKSLALGSLLFSLSLSSHVRAEENRWYFGQFEWDNGKANGNVASYRILEGTNMFAVAFAGFWSPKRQDVSFPSVILINCRKQATSWDTSFVAPKGTSQRQMNETISQLVGDFCATHRAIYADSPYWKGR